MGKKSGPPPTDPRATSAAQTGTSVSTAIANSFMNNVNQNTPEGTLTFDQTGSYTWSDPFTGQVYTVPRWTSTQTYSPEQQKIYDQEKAAEFNLARLANDQSAFLNEYMGQPVELGNEAVESRLFELGSARLDPYYEKQQEELERNLANRGIMQGSDAYTRALDEFNFSKNRSYNDLMLSGRAQANQELLTERNQPLNEIMAMLSGAQVQQPNWINAGQPQIPTTDNAGIIANYDAQMAQRARDKQGMFGSILGGLGGLFTLSDKRAKTDIKKVGKTDDGQNIYRYRYKGGGPFQLGLMAQEVEKKRPEAVANFGGLKAVDYERATA